ncbi:MAG: pyridoxamine 5'-phosphate oxidase family protein [Candidatus Dormibacteraeota bacterium]|uniref:Pyridoxamine 5'-phosphate oxidase family protein n=1 Tax=Candidatus Dormiibacter inghamiae TaxID=3127013 RepID=A0A934KCF0_9BACT|nr:pyridoxamine 5'-phosphate oxidase family protein [Candidatus Dormibacteraeota bacterium]MBJ7607571.1 pyridoxamine 5'-phosphate oxidase family protein [Candidatus Dormibacteraeota bacterium]
MPEAPAPSSRNLVRRHPERARYEAQLVEAILDEAMICHLGFIAEGVPYVVPTMYARAGNRVYIHGSPASRMLQTAAGSADVCLTVTLLDGLVMARSAFHHSMNYRSVMILGRARQVLDPAEKMAAFERLVEHVCRGRWAEVRQPSAKELNSTTVLALALEEASAKLRSGGPSLPEADEGVSVWAGEIPLRTVALPPAGEDQPAGAAGSHIVTYSRPGWTAPPDPAG